MSLDNQDILFASLLGNQISKSIPRFDAVQNELIKHVLPPIPFLPIKNKTGITEVETEAHEPLWEADKPTPIEKQFFPLSFILDENRSKIYFTI